MIHSASDLFRPWVEISPALDCSISGLCLDSRTIQLGEAFFALKGTQGHGKRYAQDAITRGAKLICMEGDETATRVESGVLWLEIPELGEHLGKIADRFYGDPSREMDVIAVTGTNGKTSIAHFVAQLLESQGKKTALLGTVGTGFMGALVPSALTTPDVFSVRRFLARFRDGGARAVVMEVSSHALVQGRVQDLRFKAAAFSNLSRDHLDYHGDMASYFAAKRRLFTDFALDFAAINIDCDYGRKLLDIDGLTTLTYSNAQESATIRAENADLNPDGIGFTLCVGETQYAVSVPLYGEFNIDNALAAITIMHGLGYSVDGLQNALARLTPVKGRMNGYTKPGCPRVFVDFAHTPDALARVLQSLRKHIEGEIVCVFGCGGDRDSGKRSEMATVAQTYADTVIVTNDNPRTESPEAIFSDIRSGFTASAQYQTIPDREQAITDAIINAPETACVLIAGKGHENHQIIGRVKLPFDDGKVCEQAMQRRHHGTNEAI